MKLKGIVRGQMVELPQGVKLPDGTEVMIDLNADLLQNDAQIRLAKLQKLFGGWRDQTDLVEIFEEIDRERHDDFGRSVERL